MNANPLTASGAAIVQSKPLVTVHVITYNHQRYIARAVESVLSQTYDHLQIIIMDDGSTDGTPDVIAQFKDPRILSLRQKNCGPSIATNQGLARCTGQYLALLSGDDVCAPNRVQRQLEEYVKGPTRLLFSDVSFIDDVGNPLTQGHFAASLFQPFSHQAEIIERFFFGGNFINAITTFTEPDLLRRGRRFDPGLYQLQDFCMWVDLVKHYPFQFLPDKLVYYRIRSGGENLSFPSQATNRRSVLENYLIMQRFFDNMPEPLFFQAFGRHLIRKPPLTPLEIRCEQAFLLVRSQKPFIALIGMLRLHDLLAEQAAAEVLEQKYNYTAVSFGNMLKSAQL